MHNTLQLSSPLAWAYRDGIDSTLPSVMTAIVAGLQDAKWLTITKVAGGYFLMPATAETPGARPLSHRRFPWTTTERQYLKRHQAEAVLVATAKGMLATTRPQLPAPWTLSAIPELSAGYFSHPGRETAWSALVPVSASGVRLASGWARRLGIPPDTPLFLERSWTESGRSMLMVTTENRGGLLLDVWRAGSVQLSADSLLSVIAGHTIQITGFPGFGWLIRESSRTGAPTQLKLAAMPDLSSERIYGKTIRSQGLMRGTIHYADIPSACLIKAGFVIGDQLASTRLPGGGIRIERSDASSQKVRRGHSIFNKTSISYRVGERELHWMQALADIQIIVCDGALVVLPAEVANDIVAFGLPGRSNRVPVRVPVGTGDVDVCIPAEAMRNTDFVVGARYQVQVGKTSTVLRLAANGPWIVEGTPDAPQLNLPPEFVCQVSGPDVAVVIECVRELRLEA